MSNVIMDRMKENYEKRSQSFLLRRTPVIIRLDGKAFHTYTKSLKSFDETFADDMIETTKFLLKNIQGAEVAYTQSDEISLILTDYAKLETSAWFDYNVQKMCSIASSICTAKFNELRISTPLMLGNYNYSDSDVMDLEEGLPVFKLAFFDARVFNIPKEEIINYFLARQQDCITNSINTFGRTYFSHQQLLNKNSSLILEMMKSVNLDWNDLDDKFKYGTFVSKVTENNRSKLITTSVSIQPNK